MNSADFLTFFAKWKDVIGAVIALLGIFFLIVQITHTARAEREKLRRRQLASIATLPLALSSIGGYAKRMMQAMGPIQQWDANRRRTITPIFDGPEVPTDAIDAIERVIEAAPDGKTASALAAILSDIQVLNSRTSGLRGADNTELSAQASMIDDNIILAANVYARTTNLFDFARSVADAPDPEISSSISALNLASMRDSNYPRIHERLARRAARLELTPQSYRRRAWVWIGEKLGAAHRKIWPE